MYNVFYMTYLIIETFNVSLFYREWYLDLRRTSLTVESDEPVGGDSGACRVVGCDPESVRTCRT